MKILDEVSRCIFESIPYGILLHPTIISGGWYDHHPSHVSFLLGQGGPAPHTRLVRYGPVGHPGRCKLETRIMVRCTSIQACSFLLTAVLQKVGRWVEAESGAVTGTEQRRRKATRLLFSWVLISIGKEWHVLWNLRTKDYPGADVQTIWLGKSYLPPQGPVGSEQLSSWSASGRSQQGGRQETACRGNGKSRTPSLFQILPWVCSHNISFKSFKPPLLFHPSSLIYQVLNIY